MQFHVNQAINLILYICLAITNVQIGVLKLLCC